MTVDLGGEGLAKPRYRNHLRCVSPSIGTLEELFHIGLVYFAIIMYLERHFIGENCK